MKTTTIIGILFCGLYGFSQPKDISLPESNGEEITIKTTIPILSLYITKEQEVYFEGQRLYYYDEITAAILKAKRNIPAHYELMASIYIYADKDVRYSFIDAIKEEIAGLVARKYLYYKTGNDYDNILQATPFRLNGSTQKAEIPKPILTVEDEKLNEEMNAIPLPPPPPVSWRRDLEGVIYSADKDSISAILSNYTSEVITLISDDMFLYKGEKYRTTDKKTLKEIVIGDDFLLMNFDKDLKYGEYVKAIQFLNEVLKETEQKEPCVIEVSNALETLFRKRGIHIMNE